MGEHQSPAGGVLVPGLQAILTGLFLGSAAGSLALLLEWPSPILIGLAVASISGAFTWLHLLSWWRRIVESLNGIEPDVILEPAEPESVRVIVTNEDRTQGTMGDLPVPENLLRRLGAGVLLEDRPVAESYWTGSEGPFSVRQFRKLRDVMVSRGWLEWKNPYHRSQGVRVTSQGKAVLKYFAELHSPPMRLENRPEAVHQSNGRADVGRA